MCTCVLFTFSLLFSFYLFILSESCSCLWMWTPARLAFHKIWSVFCVSFLPSKYFLYLFLNVDGLKKEAWLVCLTSDSRFLRSFICVWTLTPDWLHGASSELWISMTHTHYLTVQSLQGCCIWPRPLKPGSKDFDLSPSDVICVHWSVGTDCDPIPLNSFQSHQL